MSLSSLMSLTSLGSTYMCRLAYIRIFFAALVLIALAAAPVCADVVVLQNGESLSGTFSRIRENTLIFRTTLQGQMMTPMSEVRTLSTDKMLCVTMTDGRVFYGRLGVAEDAQHLFPLNGDAPQPLDVAAIQETLAIPTPPAAADARSGEGWDLSAGTGVQWRSDSDTAAPHVRLDASGRGDSWRLDANALVERADPDQFPEYVRAQAELLGKGSTAPLVRAEIDRDLDRSLELRQNLTLGLYQSLFQRERSAAGAVAGFDLDYERGRHESGDYGLNLRLGLRYYQMFARRNALSTALMLLPSLTDSDGLRAQSETAFIMPVTDRLQLRLDLIIGYDNNPLNSDVSRWNATVGAGLNLAF